MDTQYTNSEQPNNWTQDFALKHNVILKYESPLPGGVKAYKYEGEEGQVVVLDSTLPLERSNFSLAHEVAHILKGHHGNIKPEEEQEANLLASRLILPTEDFATESWRSVRELKTCFPHASYEVIARRRLAFLPGVLTIIDNGIITSRLFSEHFNCPRNPTPPEWNVINRAIQEQSDINMTIDGFNLSATYVDEGRGVVRILLYVEEG